MHANREEPLRTLALRVVDNAKTYVQAEMTLIRSIAAARVTAARPAAIMIVAAVFLLQAALTVLVAALGMALAIWIGPAGGLAVGAVLVLLLAGLLALLAVRRLQDAFK